MNFEVQLILFDCLFDLRSMREWSQPKDILYIYNTHTQRALNINIKKMRITHHSVVKIRSMFLLFLFLFFFFHSVRSYIFFGHCVFVYNENNHHQEWCDEGSNEAKNSV